MLRSVTALLIVLASGMPYAMAQDSAGEKIKAGRAALLAENPQAALELYRAALAILPSEARQDRFVTLMGIGRSAAWLEQYQLAERSYREALTLASSDEDRVIAAAGLSEMLNVLERPRAAFGLSRPLASTSLAHAVQAARAALILDWPDKAREALETQASSVTPEIEETRVGRTFRTQQEELAFRTGWVLSSAAEYAKDSDNVRTYDVLVRAGMSPPSAQAAFGITRWDITARHQTIDDGSRRTEVPQLEGGMKINASDDIKLLISAGAAEARGWTYPVGTARVSYRPSDDWGAEISTDHDAVRTVTALANRTDYSTATIGGDVRLVNTTFAAAVFRQWFSDENERDGWVGRITPPSFLPFGPGGPATALQLYARRFDSSRRDVVGYFNPERYHEERLNLIVSTRFSPTWTLRMVAGVGQESIEGTRSSTLNVDARVSGRLSPATRIDFSLRHGDSAAFSSSGVGYSQTAAGVTLGFLL